MRCSECGHQNRSGARFCEECGTALSGPPSTPVAEPAAPVLPASVGGGRYEVRRLLGEGARKRVYRAVDARLGREVAVAVVKTDGLDDAGHHRIEREARAMARLGDHPNIVTVFDVGEDGGQPYIVSQLMPGGTVSELLGRADGHRLPIDDAIGIAEQVALALEHAHELGIVHRDLKPANVWLAGDGTALLGDFGLAVTVDQSRLTSEGMVVGTVAYLAPEQAVGRAPDARSDLYSLGALLYELVAGRPPFLGDDTVAVISQHLNTAPVAPSWHNAAVPTSLERLVLHLLEKDPGERPQQASEVIGELRRIRERSMEPGPAEIVAPPAGQLQRVDWGRFVGRARELGELKAAFDASLSGKSRLVMVVGEPGIGKTRLGEELAVYAGVRGAQVCWGHCFEGEVGLPYLPFVEAFRAYVRARPDAELRAELGSGAPEVANLVSEIRLRFPDLPPSPALEGDAERMRLFEGVATFLRNASAARPLVILLDDLHWADKPSLLLLQYLARNLGRDRVLIVGTYRDVELERAHPLADAVATLRREHLYQRVLLRGLPPEDVKALIEVLGDQEAPAEFAQAIFRETEGNPFFVVEILGHLVETGTIRREGDQWVGDAEFNENLPEGIREVIGRRLSHLSEPCNRMLTVAAAMPAGFSVEVVGDVTGGDDDTVLDLLDEALGARIVRERAVTSGTYEFTHALIRQTLYGELSTPRRVRLHRQIADAFERRFGAASDAHLAELAYHCFQAAPGGDVDKAVGYATRAAERAREQAAHEEAARFSDMALQALDFDPAADPIRRAEILLALGDARNLAGEPGAARDALRHAAEIARADGDNALLARVALTAERRRWTGTVKDPELAALREEAIAGLGDAHPEYRARLLAGLAGEHIFVDAARHAALAAEAVAVARRAGDAGALARALQIWSLTLTEAERRAEWAETRDEIDRLAEESGEMDLQFSRSESRLVSAAFSGDRPLYEEKLAAVVRLASESRSPAFLAGALTSRVQAAVMEGHYAEAEQLAGEALAWGRRLRDSNMIQSFGIGLFSAWRERGRLAELEAATKRLVEEQPEVLAWRAGLAHLLCEIGKFDEAQRQVDILAADRFAAVPEDVARLFAHAATAEAIARLGDREHALTLYDLMLPAAGDGVLLGANAYFGAVDRYLGLLATLLGRYDAGAAHFEAALEIHERMHAWPLLARSRYDYARLLVARDGPGDRERAVALLNEALDAANEIGMPRLVEEALAVKLALQGVASSSPQASIDAVAAAVSLERPDLRGRAAVDGQVAILFSDIEGYTSMTDRLGDERTQTLLRAHNDIVRSELVAHGGAEVKSQGDGFMLAFPDPADALRFAIAVQHAIAQCDFGSDAGPVRVRMGVHAGEVIREGDDFFGRTVIVAARIAAQAGGGEVLVTGEVCQAVKEGEFTIGDARDVRLKGLRGTYRASRLSW